MENITQIANNITNAMTMGIFNDIEEPKSAEEYTKSSGIKKFMWTMKWSQVQLVSNNKNYVKMQLKKYDKSLIKEIYRIYYKETNIIDENKYDNLEELAKNNNISLDEVKYLKIYGTRELKRPKYENQKRIKIIKEVYELKGDDYMLSNNLYN